MTKRDEETKQCQNCKTDFTIEPEDFAFYERVEAAPPTFCPECRMIRRMSWRNERSLYRKKDNFGKEIISIYSPDKPINIYERTYWWSDKWDPLSYGKSYDFSQPFFRQFKNLLETVPQVAIFNSNPVNSDYCNHSGYMKDSYLASASWECERVLYSDRSMNTKDSVDVYTTDKCELCYDTVDCFGSYKLFFSQQCASCSESSFLFDCRNCRYCFGCVGLRNKQYYIFNKPYTKEAYEKKMKGFDLGDFRNLGRLLEEFPRHKLRYPVRAFRFTNVTDATGNNLSNVKNCFSCFDMRDNVEDGKYLTHGFTIKDSYDGFGVGLCELLYEGVDTGEKGASKARFSVVVHASSDTHYCFNCKGSHDLFGCVGLRNKQYCILNKQYTKEEYKRQVARIIEQMSAMPYTDRKGRTYKYGEFFPPELSPFAYNETIAQEYFPLTKEQAIEKGYEWKDAEKRNYQTTMAADQLPDHIRDVPDSILKETIGCMHAGTCNEQCATAFKIIPQELEFYRAMNLPLPRFCPNCRHYQRLSHRNPLKLWHRRCQCAGAMSENEVYANMTQHFHEKEKCPNEFETSYSPARKEIVYCEKCYQAEVAG